jgi:hypothetical protein
MSAKLTLTVNESVVAGAKQYARENHVSLSKMVEFYFRSLSTAAAPRVDKLPPITRELTGIAEHRTNKRDKVLLAEALIKRHLT